MLNVAETIIKRWADENIIPSVLCACPEDEFHEVGLRGLVYSLECKGWKVHYMGGNTSLDEHDIKCDHIARSIQDAVAYSRDAFGLKPVPKKKSEKKLHH